MVIMINPSKADHLSLDQTTMYVINNLAKLDFGVVDIVNLYATIGSKLYINDDSHTEQSQKENDQQILKSAETADTIILAWGKVGNSLKTAKKRQIEVLDALQHHRDKLRIISVPGNTDGSHPLAPAVRMQWNLKPYTPPNPAEAPKTLPAPTVN